MPEVVGALIPLVMAPRFTTYTGAGVFETAPLDVSAYDKAILTFYRGPLAGAAATPGPGDATFAAGFEEAHDAYAWTAIGSSITTYNTSSRVTLDLTKRWLRFKVTLTGNTSEGLAAITCWAVGSLERRAT